MGGGNDSGVCLQLEDYGMQWICRTTEMYLSSECRSRQECVLVYVKAVVGVQGHRSVCVRLGSQTAEQVN